MRFFIPQANGPVSAEKTYASAIEEVEKLFRWDIEPRRVYSISYVDGKKRYKVQVGGLVPPGNNHTVLAIFESHSYVIYTSPRLGSQEGLKILVDKDNVIEVVDFDTAAVKKSTKALK